MKQVVQKPKIQNNKPKIVRKMGQWVEKPRRMEILTCSCGNKYIKTRDRQTVCLRCISLKK